MNRVKVCIWGRDFDINYSFQNFPGEEVTDYQIKTLEGIFSVDFSESLNHVKQYVMKKDGSEIAESSIENIFRYVMPKNILITRNNEIREFAIMCNYKFDMEHGIAVVYHNEVFKTVVPQDLIL